MRVLVVTNMYPSAEHPSDGIFVHRQVEALRAFEGIDVEVCYIDTVRGTSRYLTGIAGVRRAARRFRPDLVHVHYGLTQIPALGWGGPMVTTFHGTDLTVGWKRTISRGLVGRSDAVVVVSPSLAAYLPAGVSSACVSCGNPPTAFTPLGRDEVRRALGWPPAAVLAGFASQGDRPVKDRPLFEGTMRVLGDDVEPRILGGIRPDDMPRHLAALDVLMLTSITEGSPTITKEALCCGVRVVSVDVGDVREQLAGMSGCRCVSSREPEDLAQAVRDALAEPSPDADAARERFSIQREARAVVDVYHKVLGSR